MEIHDDRTANEIYMLKSLRRAKLALRKAFRYSTKLYPLQKIDPNYAKGNLQNLIDAVSLKFYETQILLDETEKAFGKRLSQVPSGADKEHKELQKAKSVVESSMTDDFNFFRNYFNEASENKKSVQPIIGKRLPSDLSHEELSTEERNSPTDLSILENFKINLDEYVMGLSDDDDEENDDD